MALSLCDPMKHNDPEVHMAQASGRKREGDLCEQDVE
jgi:hypothetical protein